MRQSASCCGRTRAYAGSLALMAVRALVFDVFGTLVDWRSGVAEAFRAGGVTGDPEELADAWRARYRPILTEVNEGSRPWGNFDDLHLVTLDDLLAERGLDVPIEERRRLVEAWHRLDPWPDVVAGLEALRRRLVTAALSNGHLALLVDLARHGDLRFDCVLSAELAHAYKPAPEVYQTAARLLGVEPAELMLVAAHPWDLKGAREAGLRTAFVERPLEYGPGSAPRADAEADESVADLHELAGRLAG
jgi:2-haloacid dehalogenase